MTKTFKDFLVEDLDVFFDLEEMGSLHILEGKELPLVVVDGKSDEQKTGFSREQQYATQEVYKEYKTVYVKTADFFIPKVDSQLELDGVEYFVEEAKDENGVIRIVLSVNES